MAAHWVNATADRKTCHASAHKTVVTAALAAGVLSPIAPKRPASRITASVAAK